MQQINLYLPEFRPRREWITAKNSAIALGLLLLTLTGVSVSSLINESAFAAEVASLKAQNDQLQAELNTLKSKPDGQEKKQLEQQIQTARAALSNRQRLAQVLEGESLGNTQGFSAQMLALSETVPAKLSVSQFSFAKGGRLLTMRGQSVAPDTVAAYLAGLRGHTAFAGAQFGQLQVAAEGGLFRFAVLDEGRTQDGRPTAMAGGARR